MTYLDEYGHPKERMPYNMGGIFHKCVKFQDAVYEAHNIANAVDDSYYLQRVDTIEEGDTIILADQTGEDRHSVAKREAGFGIVTMWIVDENGSDFIEEYEDDLILKKEDGSYYICCD